MLARFAFAVAALAAATLPLGSASAQMPIPPLQPDPGEGIFLLMTDIHFDPFAEPSLVPELDRNPVSKWPEIFKTAGMSIQPYGQDSGYALTTSALGAAAAQGMTYDYVLYTGDYLSHGFNANYRRLAGPSPQGLASFAVKTAQFGFHLLSGTFTEIPIFGVMGNTDSVCGDYEIAPNSAFIHGIAGQWAQLSGQPERFSQFRTGGFYKAAHPTVADQDLIVLNNIFWTPRYKDTCNADGGDPGSAMMSWLDWQLYQTRQAGRKAQILMHVPPGINAYSTTHRSGACEARVSSFWRDPYADDFLALMRKYAGTVDYTFSGHTHMDSFTVIRDSDGTPLIASEIAPSVSPIFGNNPAFTAFLYDRQTGAVKDSATFYLSNLEAAAKGAEPEWRLEYVYSKTYSTKDLSPASRADVAERISNDAPLRQQFSALYAVKAEKKQVDPSNWKAFSCAQTATSREAYTACYCAGQ